MSDFWKAITTARPMPDPDKGASWPGSTPTASATESAAGDVDVLRDGIADLDYWIMHPDRSFTPHEMALAIHHRITALLVAAGVLAASQTPEPERK